ncbi:MAG: AMP-binding protein [Nakamurella sp.]
MDKHVMTGADPGAPGEWGPVGNVADVVHAAALRAPHDAALIGRWGSRTWAELDAAASVGAVMLTSEPRKTGAETATSDTAVTGDRVVVALPTGLELAAALFAALRAGLVAVPVDPTRTDVAWVAKRVGARVVIADGFSPAAGTHAVPAAIVVSSAQVAKWWGGQETRYDESRGEAVGEDLALLARGSRAAPPVMLSHRAILSAARAVAGAKPVALRSSDRVLQVLPLFHVVGLVTAFLPAALAGAAVVVPDETDEGSRVANAVAAVRAHRVSVLPAEPTLYRQLDRVDGFERGLGTVRLMTSGSSPLDPADFAAIRAATGQTVREGYGISEAASAIASTLMATTAKAGSAGLPYPGVEVRIEGSTDDDFDGGDENHMRGDAFSHSREGAGGITPSEGPTAGPTEGPTEEPTEELSEELSEATAEAPSVTETEIDTRIEPQTHPTPVPSGDTRAMLDGITDLVEVTGPGGEVGQISIRGTTLFSGYWPDGSGGPDSDGWFLTGDIGYLDDAGELHLVDRATETITVAGFTVYPREVEDVLVGHPLVADVAVVPMPGRGGQTVVAALVAKPGTRPVAQDVSEFAATSGLAPFKRPTDYLVVEALPRTEVGRLDRTAVRSMFAAARGITLPDQQPKQQSVQKPIPLWRRLPGTSRATGGVRRGARDTDEDLF